MLTISESGMREKRVQYRAVGVHAPLIFQPRERFKNVRILIKSAIYLFAYKIFLKKRIIHHAQIHTYVEHQKVQQRIGDGNIDESRSRFVFFQFSLCIHIRPVVLHRVRTSPFRYSLPSLSGFPPSCPP